MIYRIVVVLCAAVQGIPVQVRATIEAQPTCAVRIAAECGTISPSAPTRVGGGCCAIKRSACDRLPDPESKAAGCCDSESANSNVSPRQSRENGAQASCCSSMVERAEKSQDDVARAGSQRHACDSKIRRGDGPSALPTDNRSRSSKSESECGTRVCCCCECTFDGPAPPIAPPRPAESRSTTHFQLVETAFIAPSVVVVQERESDAATEHPIPASHNTRLALIEHWLK